MSAQWECLLADNGGNGIASLPTAAGRTFTFTRNKYVEAQFTLSHEDDAAQTLLGFLSGSGTPTLKAYRRGPNDSAGILRCNAWQAPFQEDAEEAATLTPVFRSPFARLLGEGESRGRFTAQTKVFAATDAGTIAKTLIDDTNANDGPTGLTTASANIQATKARDRTYVFSNVGEAITNLSTVLDGFDFFETFIDGSYSTSSPALSLFNVVASQGGTNPGARFEYGPGTLNNVRSMSRTTLPPINLTRVIGANGLTSVQSSSSSQAKYGVYAVQVQATDVTEQATLDDKALALLRPNPVKTIAFVPDFGLDNCPKPFDDFNLGDTCPFFARRFALAENTTVRINSFTIVVDENGNEVGQIPDPSLGGGRHSDPLHAAESDQFITPVVQVEVV